MGPLFCLAPGTIVSNALSNSIPRQYMAISASGHVSTTHCILSGHIGEFVFQCSSLGPLLSLNCQISLLTMMTPMVVVLVQVCLADDGDDGGGDDGGGSVGDDGGVDDDGDGDDGSGGSASLLCRR